MLMQQDVVSRGKWSSDHEGPAVRIVYPAKRYACSHWVYRALNNTLQDILTPRARLRWGAKSALSVPRPDH